MSTDKTTHEVESLTNSSQIYFFTKVVGDGDALSLQVLDRDGDLLSCNDAVVDHLDAAHSSEEVTLVIMGCRFDGQDYPQPRLFDQDDTEIATTQISAEVPMNPSKQAELGIELVSIMKFNAVTCTIDKILRFKVKLNVKGKDLINDPVADVDRGGSTGTNG